MPLSLSLPLDDTDAMERSGALAAARERWQFDPNQDGLPLADAKAKDGPSAKWMAQILPAMDALVVTHKLASEDPRMQRAWSEADPLPTKQNSKDKLQQQRVTAGSMIPVAARDDYAALFLAPGFPQPATRPWAADDDFFAWQRLAGPNAARLRRQAEPDPNFPVTEAHFAALGDPGDSLARARAERRLFVLDLNEIRDLARGQTQGHERHFDAASGLFVRALDGRFRAVAVQGRPGSPVVTPADGEHWRHAKLDLQVADAIWAGSVVHTGVHAFAAAFQVCTARSLAPNHPLYALLWPHFECTAFANEGLKRDVLGPGGYFDDLMAPTREACIGLAVKSVRDRPLRERSPWVDLARRGVDDVAALPQYPYRDDGMPVAKALRSWVDGYLRLWYRSDADLARDPELRAWHDSLAVKNGGPFADPGPLATVAELVDLVTTVIFEITVGHATVNYSGFDHYAWPETYPTARWTPTPAPGAALTEQDFLAALAPIGVANRLLDLTVPQLTLRANHLGHYDLGQFPDLRVVPLMKAFRDELDAIEQATLARDAARAFKFPYLAPSKVAQSIHV
ncbi:MAG: lox 2 [Myxococcaceae bacterium]|nr:lox 2 [Myxococcaceae bacterium]